SSREGKHHTRVARRRHRFDRFRRCTRGGCMINDVIKDMQKRMHGALESLHHEFKSLRTGRANVSMLDGVIVEYYGTPTPLAQVASLKVPEASMILAEPWDKSMVAAIEKAIRNADLGLNPA